MNVLSDALSVTNINSNPGINLFVKLMQTCFKYAMH